MGVIQEVAVEQEGERERERERERIWSSRISRFGCFPRLRCGCISAAGGEDRRREV